MTQLNVLVVDDDKDFAESLAMAIEGRGHLVELAFSGTEAVETFMAGGFDVAFMDVRLPGMNGVQSFLEIRRLKPDARVIMMTAYSLEQLLQQAVENGAWGVLHKPFDMEEVLQMLDNIRPEGILVVDDDADFVRSCCGLLTGHGWNVFVGRNGKQALERVIQGGVDVLVLDLRMPVLNGLETYLALKRLGHVVPTIIVTAFAEEEHESIERLTSLSVGTILRKPFDPKQLIASVERIAQSSGGDGDEQ